MTVNGVTVLHVGRVEQVGKDVAKAKGGKGRIGTSAAWRSLEHLVEDVGEVVDVLVLGLRAIGVAGSQTGSGRVLEIGTATGEDSYVRLAIGGLWRALLCLYGASQELTEHSKYVWSLGMYVLGRRIGITRVVGEGMAEAHVDAALGIDLVAVVVVKVALFGVGGVDGSVGPGIVAGERVRRVCFFVVRVSRVVLCLNLEVAVSKRRLPSVCLGTAYYLSKVRMTVRACQTAFVSEPFVFAHMAKDQVSLAFHCRRLRVLMRAERVSSRGD